MKYARPTSLLPHWVFGVLLFVFTTACQSETNRRAARRAAIEKEVALKLENFRKIKAQNCRDEVLAAASLIADSLIIADARMKLDTTQKPPKPFKPEQPTLQTLLDSVPIKPLFAPKKPKKDSSSKN